MSDKATSKSTSQLATLIQMGKEQGYLTYAEVNDQLPASITESDQIEDIVQMLTDVGIKIFESAPDDDDILMSDDSSDDDMAADEAAQVLAAVETEPGRTTDPVRMYMREMGTVDLLTREGEIAIAKRIEEGIRDVQHAMAYWPGTVQFVLDEFDLVEAGEKKLTDVIAGFLDIEEEDKPDSKSDDSSAEDEDEKEIPVAKSKSKAKKDDLDDDEDEDDADSDDDDSDDDADDNSSGLDIEEVRTRVNEVRELFATAKQALEEYGRGSAQADEAYAQLADRFMLLKLNNRMADQVLNVCMTPMMMCANKNARSCDCDSPRQNAKTRIYSRPFQATKPMSIGWLIASQASLSLPKALLKLPTTWLFYSVASVTTKTA